MPRTLTSREFNQDTGRAKTAANEAPVVITDRGKPSHVLVSYEEYERLKGGLIDELITTNSVPIETRGLPITVLSIAPLLGEAILRINTNESVTSLFKIKGF